MIIEPRVKARDIRRTHRSLFLLQGLSVFITLTNTIPVHAFLFRSLCFLLKSKPFPQQASPRKRIQLFNIMYKFNPTHSEVAFTLQHIS